MSCACQSSFGGMGEATIGRFPNIERTLAQYIARCLKTGEFFYISDELNSKTLEPYRPYADDILTEYGSVGLGFLAFLAPIFSAVAGSAAVIGKTAIALAPSVAATAGSIAAIKQISAINKANKVNGVQVPTSIAPQVSNAIQQDVLGTGMSSGTLLLLAAGFGALLLLRR
jgi:hypothetical protein